VALEPGNSLYTAQKAQSYKLAKLPDRAPGAQERFFIRYIGKDEEGNKIIGDLSPALVFTNVGIETFKYVSVPTLTVTPQAFGYLVSWPVPSSTDYPNYRYTEIYESKTLQNFGVNDLSNSAVVLKATSSTNSYVVPTLDLDLRYIKIRHAGISGSQTAYSPLSAAASATPTDPVAAASDGVPPANVSVSSAAWSGDNVAISLTMPANDLSKRFIIRLTNGSTVGYFYKFANGTATSQSITITAEELYNVMGQRFTSFTGLLQSADSADNINTGTSFTIAEKANPLSGVVPTFTAAPIANGYAVNYTLPSGATSAKVYASATSGFTPDDSTNLVYNGISPAVVIDTSFTTLYIKIKFMGLSGNSSSNSNQIAVNAVDAGALSLIDNEVKISTTGSLLAGDSATSGGRAIFNKTGTYFYDAGGNLTSQLLASAANGSPTLITTNAKIANWMIYTNKIENQLIPGVVSQYAGLSPNGTYAFWAGSNTAGGDANADFSVTQNGAVVAKNISISGGSLNVGTTSISAVSGKLIASDAEITGKITASSGSITGNLALGGSLHTGSSPSSGNRVVFNDGGIASYANGVTSPLFELTGNTGKIGGFTINQTSLATSRLTIDSANQKIVFNGGFTLDQDSVVSKTFSVTDSAGSDGSASNDYSGAQPDSKYSASSNTSSSSSASTISLKLDSANTSNSPKISLSSDSSVGATILLENWGNNSKSSIQLADGGIEFNVGKTGAVKMPGFTNRVHLAYNGVTEVAQMLMIKSDGQLSTGRAIFRSGATETSIVTNGTHDSVGLIGDLIFSTAD
jgi:hypothetical protein